MQSVDENKLYILRTAYFNFVIKFNTNFVELTAAFSKNCSKETFDSLPAMSERARRITNGTPN